jgi:hypothetical protein
VKGAWLDNGLLHVDLARPQPEPRVKTIQINRASPAGGPAGGGGPMGGGNGSVRTRVVESEPEQD